MPLTFFSDKGDGGVKFKKCVKGGGGERNRHSRAKHWTVEEK